MSATRTTTATPPNSPIVALLTATEFDMINKAVQRLLWCKELLAGLSDRESRANPEEGLYLIEVLIGEVARVIDGATSQAFARSHEGGAR